MAATRPARARIALAIASVVLGALLAEAALRRRYDTLPSLSAAGDAAWATRPSSFQDAPLPHAPVPLPTAVCNPHTTLRSEPAWSTGPGQPGLILWVIGDSFTDGVGAPQQQGFAWVLARLVAQAHGHPVQLVELGESGAGFCRAVQTAEAALREPAPPDLVVVQLFADDFETHTLMSIGGGVIRSPTTEPDPRVRRLVSRSYLANLLWFGQSLARGIRPARHVDTATQAWFRDHMARLRSSFAEAGIGLVVTLLAPTGLHLCPAEPRPETRCAHFSEDMVLIGNLLDEAGVPFVDLREHWLGKPEMVQGAELEAVHKGELEAAVHPDAAGHESIARALLPAVLAARPAGPGP